MVDELIAYFNRIYSLTAKEKEQIALSFTERKVRRRGLILQQGETCRHYTFVVKGCFKLYAVDQEGKEHNLEFAQEDDWICDLASFYAERPGNVYAEALEPSVILQIKRPDLIHLYSNYRRFNTNFRVIIERKYIDLQARVFQNISATAEERYWRFLEDQPKLAARLPNTQIASYLGITPEFLSMIRKKRAQG